MPRQIGNADHRCHAKGCDVATHPRMFMCARHWRLIPKAMQNRLWAVYVSGQEVRKDPTSEYLRVARELIEYIAEMEGV